ncbi:MAG: hypothetical protein JW755_13780 [Candidatus Aminicenantes bacterium]|nr:hypothetical protein [Candidatus Aminicenantes bacterium]
MKKTTVFFLLFLVLITINSADILTFSLIQNATDNLFQNKDAHADMVSLFGFSIDKDLSRTSLFAQGGYNSLWENPDAAHLGLEAGIDHFIPVNNQTALYLLLDGGGIFYRQEYSDFNHISLDFYTALKSYLTQTSIFKLDSASTYKNYNLPIFDSLSQSIHLSLDKYFQTKTTFQADLDWGYKYFLHPNLLNKVSTDLEYPASVMGRGKGYPKGKMFYQTNYSSDKRGQGIQVFSLSGTIAQGLGSSVGLRVSGTKKFMLSGENPFTYIEDYYMIENPSYDSYSWEGWQWEAAITAVLSWNIELKIGYNFFNRSFPGIDVLNEKGETMGEMREDIRRQIALQLKKDFRHFSVFLSYTGMTNSSNDIFFDWNGQFLSAGIEWNIFYGARE